jgi:autotransporter-associated beta strand protein
LEIRFHNQEKGRRATIGGVVADGANGSRSLTVRMEGFNGGGTGNHQWQIGQAGGAANTFSGGLLVSNSANTVLDVHVAKADALGSGPLNFSTNTGSTSMLLQGFSQTFGGLLSTNNPLISSTGSPSLSVRLSDGVTHHYAGRISTAIALSVGAAVGATGTGVQTLSGTNTYTGPTTLAGGTLALGSTGAMNGGGTVTFTGGTVRHSNVDGATIDLGARIRNSSSAVKVDTFGNDVSYVAIDSSNLAGLEKLGNGTLTLAGANTYAGNSTVAAGTLRIGTGSTAGSILGDVALSAAGATLAFNRSNEFAFTGAITGGGQVRQVGLGRLTLSNAASSYSGGTFVDSGTLAVTAANALGAGNVTVASGARLQLDVTPALGGGSAISLASGSQLVTVGNVAAPLAAGSSLSGWSSTSAGGTAAGLLQASALTATTFTTGWVTNPGDYVSDILTLDGTTASGSNVMVLSMAFDAGYSGLLADLNIFTRPNASGTFAAVGTSFRGEVPWTSEFQTPGEYGVSGGRVWAVTDTNSQFVVNVTVVPEPAAVMLAACGVTLTIWGLRRRRRCAG